MTYEDLLKLAQQGARGFTTGLLGGPVDLANMAMANAGGDKPVMGSKWIGEKLQGMGLLAEEPKDTAGSIAEFAGGLLGPGAPVKAAAAMKGPALAALMFHGSPHKFDAFKLDKIGTGEGAQAYGHGLYFADNPAGAKEYARMELTGPGNVARKAGLDGADPLPTLKKVYPGMPAQWYENAIRNGNEKAHLYKVDVPDEAVANMLHWDKPLSEQPASVQKALEKLKPLLEKSIKDGNTTGVSTGQDVIGALAPYTKGWAKGGNGADEVSAMLKEAGIPGIRYLDQGSRGKGGTYNTVLFDDALAKILSRE